MSNRTQIEQPVEIESAPNLKISSLIILFGVPILLLITFFVFVTSGIDNILTAPNGKINLEIADSKTERTQGLSGREFLNNDQGLLFIFDESSKQNCFWMKDMEFSIDMVWLDENQEVVTVVPNVSPETYPDNFCPEQPAKYGLELSSGNTSRLKITTGTKLRSKKLLMLD